MRTSRMAGLFLLGLIIGALLVYALRWKIEPPAVLQVSLDSRSASPRLQKGQVLTWVGSKNGSAFTVVWKDGRGPCQNMPKLPSKDVDGIQTASCKVETPPPDGGFFGYAIEPGINALDGGGDITPCWGCYYFGDNNNLDTAFTKQLVDGSPNIAVSCSPVTNGGIVKLDPTRDQPSNFNLKWFHDSDIQIEMPVFTTQSGVTPAPGVVCQPISGGASSCTFPRAPTDYPYSYTINATGSTGTMCGADNKGTGTGTGYIDAP